MKKRIPNHYPRYLYPKLRYHRIPPHPKMKRMMVLRLMLGAEMPKKGLIDRDTMAAHMRDSQFYGGISVNLLYMYKKRDVVWWIDDEQLTDYWDYRSTPPGIPASKLLHNKKQGYFGFCIRDIERISSTYQVFNDKGKFQREDGVICKVEHWPTRVNYWHYNIFLYGVEKKKDAEPRIYLLSSECGKSKVKNVASNLMEEFFQILRSKQQLHTYCIPKHLFRKCKKWEREKGILIQKGLVAENDFSYR